MALSLERYARYTDVNFTQLLKQRIKKEKERSMLIALEKIDHLPENLIIEILSRLPVKDVLQFKSVCKSWYEIISSPNFVTKHLNNYYDNDNDDWHGCLLVQFYVSHAEIQLYELLVDETPPPRVLAYQVLYDMPMYCTYVSGPCDGLYYVYQYDFSGRSLWNPAINDFKILPDIVSKPHLPPHFTCSPHEVFGFGFDHVTRDYKVVVMKSYWSANEYSTHPVSVLVYSLRTDSWRYCGDLAKAYDMEINKCYIYVDECCYWFGSLEYSSEVIISFDMTNDSFREIDVPDYAQPSCKCLAVYYDSLAFLSLHKTDKIFDIWTWSEGCWTKKFTVGPLPDVRSPVGHWRGNRLLLQCEDGKLLLFNPDTQQTNDLGFQRERWCEGVFAYMESLVSIKDKSEAGQQPEEN